MDAINKHDYARGACLCAQCEGARGFDKAPAAVVAATPASAAALMYPCKVIIHMPDGSLVTHLGLYAHGFDAHAKALELFPTAQKITVTVVGDEGGV